MTTDIGKPDNSFFSDTVSHRKTETQFLQTRLSSFLYMDSISNWGLLVS